MGKKRSPATPMEKLKELLDEWQDQNTRKAIRLSKKYPVLIFHVCDSIYRHLKRGESCGFIELDVKEILESCGFSIQEEGIGWRVFPDKEVENGNMKRCVETRTDVEQRVSKEDENGKKKV